MGGKWKTAPSMKLFEPQDLIMPKAQFAAGLPVNTCIPLNIFQS
jgi:hypothetical protein